MHSTSFMQAALGLREGPSRRDTPRGRVTRTQPMGVLGTRGARTALRAEGLAQRQAFGWDGKGFTLMLWKENKDLDTWQESKEHCWTWKTREQTWGWKACILFAGHEEIGFAEVESLFLLASHQTELRFRSISDQNNLISSEMYYCEGMFFTNPVFTC